MRNVKNGIYSSPASKSRKHGCTPQRRKGIIVAVVVIGILALVAGLFYVGFAVKVETCTTPTCVHSATEILRHIDIKADPCEDFYRFSCGNFLQNTHLQNNRRSRWGSRSVEDIADDDIQSQIREMLESPIIREDSKSFNVAKKYYRACMNETAVAEEGLNKIKEILKNSGGWPTLEGYNWKQENFDWMKSLHKLREMGVDFDIFFFIKVDRDGKETDSRYVVGIRELPYSQVYRRSEMKSLIIQYMIDVAVIFGANRNTAAEDARETLRLFSELGKISKESINYNITEKDWERRTIPELQYKYRDIQWYYFLSGLLKPAANINYDDEVVITQPRYVEFMENFLAITSQRSLANLISWHTIQYLMNFMPAEIVKKSLELADSINGKMMNFKIPRYKTCVSETKVSLGPVVAAAYIQNFFPEDIRYKILTMIRNIRKQTEETLMRLEWMDVKTKKLIIQTLHFSTEKLPSTGDLLNLLEENKSLYSQIKINETRYLEAFLQLNLVKIYKQQSKLRSEYEEDFFSDIEFLTGFKVSYSPRKNLLTFPVGIFGGVYYQNERPEYMNYGILGSIIAHEVSHIFMRAVREDLPSGELRSWWSSNSLANYDQKLQCLSNQYSNFGLSELRHKHLNPAKTRDEDMADLAGIKISYDTYINLGRENGAQPLLPGLEYSPNQLFWISAAIRHCSKYSPEGMESHIDNYRSSLQQFRVNGPLQNLKEFAFDFGCPVGSKMNPETKCEVW